MTSPARAVLVGQVLGREDATPLGFWVAVHGDAYLQLDDVVLVKTSLPDGRTIHLYGVVDLVRARHEGTQFDSDVFLVTGGVLPATVSMAARVAVTRVDPEVFVPPRPGESVFLGVLTATQEVRYVLKSVSPNPLRYDGALEQLRPAYCTSIGHVLLAELGERELDDYLARTELVTWTEATPTDPATIRSLVRAAAARGSSFSSPLGRVTE